MASTYLTRTPSSAGNRRTFTISFWVKRTGISVLQKPFSAGVSLGEFTAVEFESTDQFRLVYYSGSSLGADLSTNRVFRDTNAWYHLVWSVDTTQATASDRVKLYVNGVQETSFDSSHSTYPAQNFDYNFSNNQIHDIGRGVYNSSEYFDGSMAHFHFIDGTAYAASTFGETDATTGIWKPKTAPSVTYGTNGFFLKFENSGSMGTDSSGNGNNFTVSGGTLTQTEDTPSNVFAVLNPLNNNNTLSQGNLKAVTATNTNTAGTLGFSSGKWYYEVKVDTAGGSYPFVGFGLSSANYIGVTTSFVAGTSAWVGSGGLSNGDIVGLAIDTDLNTFKGYINGVEVSSSSPYISGGTITSGQEWIPVIGGVSSTLSCNFGNGYFGTTAVASANADDNGIGAFEYAPPTGHLAICTKNINAQEYS